MKNIYSFLIGRWQPLHDGHKKLIDTVLSEGKDVMIGIRDTEVSKKNPFTTDERKEMFRKAYGDRIKVIVVPDIEAVVYGRGVGYDIREIDLDVKTKGISATNIRKGKIWWFTGNSGAGKTTIAEQFADAIKLDGDDMRECWDLGFSKADRWEQNMRVAKIAKVLRNQGHKVVVSTICPFKALRQEIRELTGCKFIFVEGGQEPSKKFPYEKD